ncbi:exopolysaccharide biosynthesis polyprenyl glycosylphosphotransferase [Flavobacterium sp. HSC-61S13]|uniref:exopolysaccharide biosynthesis polyprenyl glycosylphosphotransferase n=1 Tax=Flavobacterium sp. HSC-61S13 TaxID=2910963 RepID=UPI0020A219EC|nr:putative colanic acid biosynthesis UDP-glucose lipid carrier transferase [Flavobacterium sp. HSC-61S13]
MKKIRGRYSKFIRPITLLIDITILNLFAYYLLPEFSGKIWFHLFISLSWLLSSWVTMYYDVFRFTRIVKIFEKIFKQFVLQFVLYSAYNGFFSRFAEPKDLILYGVFTMITISVIKISIFYSLKIFRSQYGGNYRRVVIIGKGKEVKQLQDFFNKKTEYGYHLVGTFKDEAVDIQDILDYVEQEKIDEIYISLYLVSTKSFGKIVDFADNNLKVLKYIPKDDELIGDNYNTEYYDLIPIIPRRKIPLDSQYNRLVKRTFDLVFSSIVIVFLLSWLIPLISILIKLESRGPVFFKQLRNGMNNSEFTCYKFRSMYRNEACDDQQASKGDARITRLGKFIRKTSIDELPQFFNVFLGDMSVVGPRPHMVMHTQMYAKKINKFMVRHLIKPGITGMAQTHGYRGEVENDRDIINRVKYDIFYIENWSVFLDLKIIYLTIYNVFKGEDKAY